MKKFHSAVMGLMMIASTSLAQTQKSPVTFNAYEWDFGTINAMKGTVCHTFTLKNTSNAAIKIGRAILILRDFVSISLLLSHPSSTTILVNDLHCGICRVFE